MIKKLEKTSRSLATGVCFAVFGLGQLAMAATVFPLLMILVRDEQKRSRLAKTAVHYSFRLFVETMRFLRVLGYETRHLERLDRPGLLVLSNHPSLIDIVFLIAFIRQADCIVKAALIENPFTRYAILACGFLHNATGPDLLEDCGKSLDRGNALIIFPEGTRSEAQGMRKFQRGAANIAVRQRRDITPVVIRVRDHNLSRSSRWWKVAEKRAHYEFEVCEDIPVGPFLTRQPEAPAAARDLTDYLTRYFKEKVYVEPVA